MKLSVYKERLLQIANGYLTAHPSAIKDGHNNQAQANRILEICRLSNDRIILLVFMEKLAAEIPEWNGYVKGAINVTAKVFTLGYANNTVGSSLGQQLRALNDEAKKEGMISDKLRDRYERLSTEFSSLIAENLKNNKILIEFAIDDTDYFFRFQDNSTLKKPLPIAVCKI